MWHVLTSLEIFWYLWRHSLARLFTWHLHMSWHDAHLPLSSHLFTSQVTLTFTSLHMTHTCTPHLHVSLALVSHMSPHLCTSKATPTCRCLDMTHTHTCRCLDTTHTHTCLYMSWHLITSKVTLTRTSLHMTHTWRARLCTCHTWRARLLTCHLHFCDERTTMSPIYTPMHIHTKNESADRSRRHSVWIGVRLAHHHVLMYTRSHTHTCIHIYVQKKRMLIAAIDILFGVVCNERIIMFWYIHVFTHTHIYVHIRTEKEDADRTHRHSFWGCLQWVHHHVLIHTRSHTRTYIYTFTCRKGRCWQDA